jgi:hypothetical protein
MRTGIVRYVASLAGLVLALAPPDVYAIYDKQIVWMPPNIVWVPPTAAGKESLGLEEIIPDIVITTTPKPTADASKFTKEYVIDLKAFNISNDGTNAAETSKGLNAALQHAKTLNANRIVFPKGTYLISETDPLVIDHRNTIIDLNTCTLQINTNGLPKYAVVQIVDGAENARITNGTLRGDKDTHDYKTVKGSHEHGIGLLFIGGRGIEADHLTLTNMTGDGACGQNTGTRTRPELLARIPHMVDIKNLEQGAFSDDGARVASTEKIRTIKPYDTTSESFSQPNGGREFEFGWTGGYGGFPYIKCRVYQAYFYGPNMEFMEKRRCVQFKKVAIPAGAKFMNLEFNQPEVVSDSAFVGRITTFRPPTDVHLHHNVLSSNRRQGLSVCGGQKWLIEANVFEKTGGTPPSYGVDFEDGWELMQDIVLRNNVFRGNQGGDLVVCAGSELLFEGNQFEKTVGVYGRTHNYIFRNNHLNGSSVGFATRNGVARFSGNTYENCTISVKYDAVIKGAGDGLYRKPGQPLSTPSLRFEDETLSNVKKVTGTYFDFARSKMTNVNFVAGADTALAAFKDCQFDGVTLQYEAKGPEVSLSIQDCKGTLSEDGPGLARRKPKP